MIKIHRILQKDSLNVEMQQVSLKKKRSWRSIWKRRQNQQKINLFKKSGWGSLPEKITRAGKCLEMTNKLFASIAHCEEMAVPCAGTLLKEEFIRKSLSN